VISLAAIQAELHNITTRLNEATGKIHDGITLDLSDLAPRTAKLCDAILQLPPEQALDMLTTLNDAVSKLDALSDRIKS